MGYEIFERSDGWFEVLASREDERWYGRGRDLGEALTHLSHQMFPSFAARVSAQRALASAGSLAPATERTSPLPAAASQPAAEFEARESASLDMFRQARPARFEAAARQPVRPPTREFEPRRKAPELSLEAATERIHRLAESITTSQEELGLNAPERQRLVILSWIAEARSLQDYYPTDRELEATTKEIAGTLGSFCKRWWPGNVRALQRHSMPDEVTRDLQQAGIAPQPGIGWAQLAVLARQATENVEERDARAGFDAGGWADAMRTTPLCADPDGLLAQLADEVRAMTGALGLARPLPNAPPPDVFLTWVRKARWLRTQVEDAELWADLAGRLRYLASTFGSLLAAGDAELDPRFCPTASWASLLGFDRGHKLRSKQVRELFDKAPPGGGRAKRSEVIEWVCKALAFADTHMTEIAEAARPAAALINELLPEHLPENDRLLRRRLVRLQTMLGGRAAAPAEVEAAEAEATAVATAASTAASAGAATETTDEDVLPRPSLSLVLPMTRGRRVSFISNRNDPELMRTLESTFELKSIDWCEGGERRVQSLADSILHGSADLVFAATGFQSHVVDGILARACREARIPYVRVNRGRPMACLRALMRLVGDRAAAARAEAASNS